MLVVDTSSIYYNQCQKAFDWFCSKYKKDLPEDKVELLLSFVSAHADTSELFIEFLAQCIVQIKRGE